MTELLQAMFAFPTAIFSFLLMLVLMYWTTVILGALDLNILDSALEGVLDGVGEAVGADFGGDFGDFGGHVGEAGGDVGGVGGDVGDVGDVGGDVGGHGEVGDGHGEVGDGHGDAHGEGDGHGGGLLNALGLVGVPLTVSLSILIFVGWLVCYFGMQWVGGSPWAVTRGVWGGILVLLVAFVVAVVTTSIAARPLRPVFETRTALRSRDLVGQVCTVMTGRVDDGFGQAEATDEDGSALLLQVRSAEPDNGLKRGSKALIFKYDTQREVFLVSPWQGDADGPGARS